MSLMQSGTRRVSGMIGCSTCSWRSAPVKRRMQTGGGQDHGGVVRSTEGGVASGRRSDDIECCVEQFFSCTYGANPFGSCPAGFYCPDGGAQYSCTDIQIYPSGSDADSLGIKCPTFYYAMSAPLPNNTNPTYICPSTNSMDGVLGVKFDVSGTTYYTGNAVVYNGGFWYVLSAVTFTRLWNGTINMSNATSAALAKSSGSTLTGYNVFTARTGYPLSGMKQEARSNNNFFGTPYCPGSSAVISTASGNYYYGPPYFRLCVAEFYCPLPWVQIYCSDLVVTFNSNITSPSTGISAISAGTPFRFYLIAGSGQGRGPFYPRYQKEPTGATWALTMEFDGRWRFVWWTGSVIGYTLTYSTNADPKLGWPAYMTVASFQSGGVVPLSLNVTCVNTLSGFGGVTVPQPAA